MSTPSFRKEPKPPKKRRKLPNEISPLKIEFQLDALVDEVKPKKPRKAGRGKAKGGAFERLVAKRFTLWASGQDEEYWWWRSPGSGGVATVMAQNIEITGDVIPIKPEGRFLTDKFSIEVKCGYPNMDLQHHLTRTKIDILKDFWIQCVGDATKAKKMPMLIFQRSKYSAAIGVPRISNMLLNLNYIMFNYKRELNLPPIYVFDLEDFLATLTPQDIIKI